MYRTIYQSCLKRTYHNYRSFQNKYYPQTKLFPITYLHIAQVIAFNVQKGLKGTTIQTPVAGLSYMNRMMGFPNPADHFMVK